MKSDLDVEGVARFHNDTIMEKDLCVNADAVVKDDLTVENNTTLCGNVLMKNDLDVEDVARFHNDAIFDKDVEINADVVMNEDLEVDDRIDANRIRVETSVRARVHDARDNDDDIQSNVGTIEVIKPGLGVSTNSVSTHTQTDAWRRWLDHFKYITTAPTVMFQGTGCVFHPMARSPHCWACCVFYGRGTRITNVSPLRPLTWYNLTRTLNLQRTCTLEPNNNSMALG